MKTLLFILFPVLLNAQFVAVGELTTTTMTVSVETSDNGSFYIKETRRVTKNGTNLYDESVKATLLPDSTAYNNFMGEIAINYHNVNLRITALKNEMNILVKEHQVLDSLRGIYFPSRGGSGINFRPDDPKPQIEPIPAEKPKATKQKKKKRQ